LENEGYGGKEVEDVGATKDKELKLEEIEASHTLGCVGEGFFLVFIFNG
jgi:hypothetical protein